MLDALFAKARYLQKIGNWSDATAAYEVILTKPKISTGRKIDAGMEKAKMALFNMVSSQSICLTMPMTMMMTMMDCPYRLLFSAIRVCICTYFYLHLI